MGTARLHSLQCTGVHISSAWDCDLAADHVAWIHCPVLPHCLCRILVYIGTTDSTNLQSRVIQHHPPCNRRSLLWRRLDIRNALCRQPSTRTPPPWPLSYHVISIRGRIHCAVARRLLPRYDLCLFRHGHGLSITRMAELVLCSGT